MSQYRTVKYQHPRMAPFQPDQQTVECTVANAEFYYPEADIAIPLMPQGYIEQGATSPYILVSGAGALIPEGAFINGEALTGNVASDIQELTFTAPLPSPGFVRNEVITAAAGATGVIARRYSDTRYLVHTVVIGGGWGGAVTGGSGGGAVVAGTVSANVAFRAVYDSYARNARDISGSFGSQNNRTSTHLIRDYNMLATPGATIIGATSGTVGIVQSFNPPFLQALLGELVFHADVLNNDPSAATYVTAALLGGDLAQLLNPLGGITDGNDAIRQRAARREVLWTGVQPHGSNEGDFARTDFMRMIVTGRWNNSTAYAAPMMGEQFVDGMVLRFYRMSKAGTTLANPMIMRRFNYEELWDFVKMFRL
jgi:hypothetical protein